MASDGSLLPLLNQIMMVVGCVAPIINGLDIIYLIGKHWAQGYTVQLMTYEKSNEAENSDD